MDITRHDVIITTDRCVMNFCDSLLLISFQMPLAILWNPRPRHGFFNLHYLPCSRNEANFPFRQRLLSIFNNAGMLQGRNTFCLSTGGSRVYWHATQGKKQRPGIVFSQNQNKGKQAYQMHV